MVRLTSLVALAAVAAALPATVSADMRHHRRQNGSGNGSGNGSNAGSSTGTRTRASASATAAAGSGSGSGAAAGAGTSLTGSGTLDASESRIVATITSGSPASLPTYSLKTTFSDGAKNTYISNAPPLPAASSLVVSQFPTLDTVPDPNLPMSKQFLAAVDLSGVPNIPKKTSADCGSEPAALARAGANADCWWTCGGCTRDTDVTTCPDKNTWGVSYDDGPSPYTPDLLDYMEKNNIKSTFFIVGSRAVSRPDILRYEHMTGHQLSIHTWSHTALTTQTNEQIVLELAWTRHAIQTITGVAPNTFRPPYGDIDDRVRAIAKAMSLTPIIWTSTGPSDNYDTNDWKIGAGTVSAAQVVANFNNIIDGASKLPSGYIVLAHDLYPQSVEIATEIVLPNALTATPKQTLKPIIQCLNKPLGDAYVETNRNLTNGQSDATATAAPGSAAATAAASGSGSGSSGASGISLPIVAASVGAAFFGVLSML